MLEFGKYFYKSILIHDDSFIEGNPSTNRCPKFEMEILYLNN